MKRIVACLVVGLAACATSPTVSQPPGISREAEQGPAEPDGLSHDVDLYLFDAPTQPRVSAFGYLAVAEDEGDLAKQTQNPIADLISLPLQNNFGFDYGKDNDVQWILNVQPVYPFELNKRWRVITRTVLPVIYQPAPVVGTSDAFGLGDTTFTAFFSPIKPGKLTWGVGPVILLPTSTGNTLGVGQWGLGVSAVAIVMDGPWVVGGLISQTTSFEGDHNVFVVQPIINYNLKDGWYLTSVPLITADWEATGSNTWTVPVGGGAGKIFHVGKQPMNAQVQVFYNLDNPNVGPEWSLRFQIQLLFPK